MACPSGCINGGGQIKPEQMATGTKLEPIEVLASVEANHSAMENRQLEQPNFDQLIQKVS
jgi:iron only hydrogenase large subunit-like protein